MHIPVLLSEVVEFFKTKERGVIIDATLGLGGHSKAILESCPNVRIVAFDKDIEAIALASENLADFKDRIYIVNDSFSNAISAAISEVVENGDRILGILADIGVSSYQLDTPERGFSFNSQNLDMRMNLDSILTAKTIINSYTKEQLERIFREYGEIPNYKQVANKIVESRKKSPITSAAALSSLFATNAKSRINPATLIFQALRIEVNDELGELRRFLDSIKNLSTTHLKGTKLAIISFHSLEDRIVKNAFRAWSKDCICDESVMKCECGGKNAKGVPSKKPIVPTQSEIEKNKRARSSKMRCFIFNNGKVNE